MPPKAFKVFEDASKAVRPYPRTKQARSTNSKVKKRVPLQETAKRINQGKKPINTKPETKRKAQAVATRITKKVEYSLDNLRAIFEDNEKDEPKLEFRATSTPFNSQLMNSQLMEEERINNQRQLDLEINKIHNSINKESIMLLIEQLSPPPSGGSKQAPNLIAKTKPRKKQTKLKKSGKQVGTKKTQKQTKITTGKPSGPPAANDVKPKKTKEVDKVLMQGPNSLENKRDQSLERPKQKHSKATSISKCRTRLECKPKASSKSTLKAGAKPELKSNKKKKKGTKKTKTSNMLYKGELTYKQLLLKCAKGKDPIDLLV